MNSDPKESEKPTRSGTWIERKAQNPRIEGLVQIVLQSRRCEAPAKKQENSTEAIDATQYNTGQDNAFVFLSNQKPAE
jgi:hypothetical protein